MRILALLPASAALMAMTQDSPVVLEPGQWRFTTQVDGLELPGQPAAVVASARAAIDEPQSWDHCLTPAEAADPTRRIGVSGAASGCAFPRKVFEDGRIDVVGNCRMQSGAPARITMAGSYAPTEINMQIETTSDEPVPIRLRSRLAGRRTGQCRARPKSL